MYYNDAGYVFETLTANVELTTLTLSFSMLSGASMRYNDPTGIRFYSKVDTDLIESLRAEGVEIELGTLIAPKDYLTDKELTFEQSLRCREFEPDGPNYTPRISGVMHIEGGKYDYAMSILKSNNGDPSCCNRYTFTYDNPVAGEGHFIHTYKCDGNPLPSFEGEPKLVNILDDMNAYTELLWNSLNEENKVSLFVRYIDIATGNYETKIINKNN